MNEDFTELVEFLDKKFEKIENDIKEFKDDVYRFQDKALEDLEMLKQEKIMGDELSKRKTKVLEIHNTALKDAKILSEGQIVQIKNLEAF
jgi:hypothetical protein